MYACACAYMCICVRVHICVCVRPCGEYFTPYIPQNKKKKIQTRNFAHNARLMYR